MMKIVQTGGIKIPKIKTAGQAIKPFGESIAAPDSSGALRRARQMLAGTPTAVRTRTPKIPKVKI